MPKKMQITYKTFVLEKEESVFVPKPPVVRKAEEGVFRYCSCVYVCPQFLSYPVDRWGRRIIPENARCPYVKSPYVKQKNTLMYCAGDFVYMGHLGKITTRTRGMNHLYKLYTCTRER